MTHTSKNTHDSHNFWKGFTVHNWLLFLADVSPFHIIFMASQDQSRPTFWIGTVAVGPPGLANEEGWRGSLKLAESLKWSHIIKSMDWLKALFAEFLCFFNDRICRGFNILPPIPESWKSIKNHSPWNNHGALWSWLKLRFHSLLIVRFLVTSSKELQMVSAWSSQMGTGSEATFQ